MDPDDRGGGVYRRRPAWLLPWSGKIYEGAGGAAVITEEMIEVGYRASLFASKGEVRKILTAALSASPAGVKPLEEYERQEAICTETAMSQWERSLKRPDMQEKDRVRGAVEAYKRQALAFHMLPARIMSAIEPAGVGVEASALLIANNALANEARRVGPLTIEDMAAVFDRLSKTIFSEAALADKQWHLARIEEEIKAGRSQNAISYASFAIADAEATMRRNCQYLLDVLDGQGFEERDLSEEDEDAIKGIRAVLSSPVGVPRRPRHPSQDRGKG